VNAAAVVGLAEEAAENFGPLKAISQSISILYAQYQVYFDALFKALL